MVIQEESQSISFQFAQKSLKPRQKRRSIGAGLALGIAATCSAVLISGDRVAALPSQRSQTPLVNSSVNSSLTARLYSTVETTQISTDADNSAWLYQGVVQLSYAGIIAWVIALLQSSGK
ncbi:MAG: hypothetical protein KME15_01330 [Drouetiella hepatica Uher 2000/2452]|jgi:hypothetical protein|uniref:Uncharacterized protein n=1 Tax=Drouetiella hepatica Uher 2000/2452 TaxID=904376 RepID=A0A951UL20_9CYAN|nr:hypothetical protein [Drouetiella hepatica Uher 2000/2452]